MVERTRRFVVREWPLALILLVAAVVYAFGASNGASQSFYIDERFYDRYALELAQALFLRGTPRFGYVHPSGYSLTLAVVYGALYVVGRVTGRFGSSTDFLVCFAVHREYFITAARLLSATYAVAALACCFRLADKLFDRRVAYVAVLGLGTCYPFVFYAHIAANITLVALLSLLALLAIVDVRQRGDVRSYVLAGAFIGAGIGTKYYPALLWISLLWAHRKRRHAELHKLVYAAAATLTGALVFFPLPLIAYSSWRTAYEDTLGYYRGGNPFTNALHLLLGNPPTWAAISAEPISWFANSLRVLGVVTLLWLAIALVQGARKHRDAMVLLVAPVLVLFVYQCVRGGLQLGARQLYFGLPSLWILAAVCLIDAIGAWSTWRVSLVVVALLAQPVVWLARYVELVSRPTTLSIARTWLLGHVPVDSIVLIDRWDAPFATNVGWREAVGTSAEVAADRQSAVRDARSRAAPPFTIRELSYEDARADLDRAATSGHPVYTVVAARAYTQPDALAAWGLPDDDKAAHRRQFYSDLAAATQPVATFHPPDLRALGPEIVVSQYGGRF